MHVEVRESGRGFFERCSACGRAPAVVRVRTWVREPAEELRGMPSWRVEVSHYCADHRPAVEELDR
jgi:hypothetical protein